MRILYDLAVRCARCGEFVQDSHLFQSKGEFACGEKSYIACENCQKKLEENDVSPPDAFIYIYWIFGEKIMYEDDLTRWYTWMRKHWDNPEVADAYAIFDDHNTWTGKLDDTELVVIDGDVFIIPEAELPHLGCWLPYPLSYHLLYCLPSSSGYTGEKEGKEMFVAPEYCLTFQDRQHKEMYLCLRGKFQESNNDADSAFYVLAVTGKPVDSYVTCGNMDWSRLLEDSKSWTSEEKTMVYIAHELFNGGPDEKRGIHELLSGLSETWFLTVLQGFRMRYI